MNSCYNTALKMLAQREHSAIELAKKLVIKEFDKIEITEVIQKLKQQKYQSDLRFCEMLINTRISQGKGALAIKQELKQHQINNPDLNAIDFYTLCSEVKIKKFGTKGYQNLKKKSQQIRFLQSRGFSFDEIKQAL